MKANQAFTANDEAVSPVIGVILMVAITVVLAAVVFVLVSNLSKGNDAAPTLGITADDSAYKTTINTAPNGLNYAQFNLKSDQPVNVKMNSAPDNTCAAPCIKLATANTVPRTAAMGANTVTVTGGDFFQFCGENAGSTAGAALTSVTVQIIHIATNTQVYSHTFPSIPACA